MLRRIKISDAAPKAAKISSEQQKKDCDSIVAMAAELIKLAAAGEVSGVAAILFDEDLEMSGTLHAGNVRRSKYAVGYAAQKLARQMAWS